MKNLTLQQSSCLNLSMGALKMYHGGCYNDSQIHSLLNKLYYLPENSTQKANEIMKELDTLILKLCTK